VALIVTDCVGVTLRVNVGDGVGGGVSVADTACDELAVGVGVGGGVIVSVAVSIMLVLFVRVRRIDADFGSLSVMDAFGDSDGVNVIDSGRDSDGFGGGVIVVEVVIENRLEIVVESAEVLVREDDSSAEGSTENDRVCVTDRLFATEGSIDDVRDVEVLIVALVVEVFRVTVSCADSCRDAVIEME